MHNTYPYPRQSYDTRANAPFGEGLLILAPFREAVNAHPLLSPSDSPFKARFQSVAKSSDSG